MDLPGFDPGTSRMSVSTTISPNEHTVVDRSPKLLIGLFLLKYAKRALYQLSYKPPYFALSM